MRSPHQLTTRAASDGVTTRGCAATMPSTISVASFKVWDLRLGRSISGAWTQLLGRLRQPRPLDAVSEERDRNRSDKKAQGNDCGGAEHKPKAAARVKDRNHRDRHA